jgi:hypothetical protein
MGPRRREPRQPANLLGFCLLEDEVTTVGWRKCWILDVSKVGIGITFRHKRVSELTGRGISIEVPSARDSVRVPLEGQIKNALMIQPGLVRVGIEFIGSATAEDAITAVLSALNEVNDSGATLLLGMTKRT